jgi:hypothetical protein
MDVIEMYREIDEERANMKGDDDFRADQKRRQKNPKTAKAGDPCPDCGKPLIVTLTCSDDECGTTINPKDGYKIIPEQKMAVIIVDTEKDRHGEYIPCIVKKSERGFFPTSWRWGTDKEKAQKLADDYNAKLGINRTEAMQLTLESMREERVWVVTHLKAGTIYNTAVRHSAQDAEKIAEEWKENLSDDEDVNVHECEVL